MPSKFSTVMCLIQINSQSYSAQLYSFTVYEPRCQTNTVRWNTDKKKLEAKQTWLQSQEAVQSLRCHPLQPNDGCIKNVFTQRAAHKLYNCFCFAWQTPWLGPLESLSLWHYVQKKSVSVHPPYSTLLVTPLSLPTQLLAATLCAAVNISVTVNVMQNVRPTYC